MPETVKYTFDQAFDGGAKSRYDVEIADLRGQTQKLTDEAYKKGLEDGRLEVKTGLEAEIHTLASTFLHESKRLLDERKNLETHLKSEMTQLAYNIATHISSAVSDEFPYIEMEKLLYQSLDLLLEEGELNLKLPVSLVENVSERLEKIQSEMGFKGTINIQGDSNLTGSSCSLKWKQGLIAFDQSQVAKEISDLVAHYRERLRNADEGNS